MADIDEAVEEERNEYRLAQAEHNRNSRPPAPKDGQIARFIRGVDASGGQYDIVYVDRTTGLSVLRYDGADPANTNPWYGAEDDGTCLARNGLSIAEMIDPARAVKSDDEIARAFFHPDDSYWGD